MNLPVPTTPARKPRWNTLRRRLITAAILGRDLAYALDDGDKSDAANAIFHLRRKLRQATQLLDEVEALQRESGK